ncbi:MAG: phosphate signaling complex protein PhoU [Caldilineaceae bacterium]
MAREHFERELTKLQDELLILGSMVTHALRECVKVLKKQDIIGARRLIADDEKINTKRFEIEETALLLIATQQPMARDTRLLAAFFELSTELERMGDYAKGIAQIAVYIGQNSLVKPIIDIPEMAERACKMLTDALEAFINRDVNAAYAIALRDDEIDVLYEHVHHELLKIMIEHPDKLDQANYLLWAAHNLERAGDRVTNICERIVFTVSGKQIEMSGVAREEMAG